MGFDIKKFNSHELLNLGQECIQKLRSWVECNPTKAALASFVLGVLVAIFYKVVLVIIVILIVAVLLLMLLGEQQITASDTSSEKSEDAVFDEISEEETQTNSEKTEDNKG